MSQTLTDPEMVKLTGVVQAAVRLLATTTRALMAANIPPVASPDGPTPEMHVVVYQLVGAIEQFRCEIRECAPELFEIDVQP